MAPEAVTAERVYVGLRREVVHGRHAPGAFLIANSIADEFGTSIAPVRDALHRLVGEGLVEAHAGGGFRTPVLTESSLRDLLVWHGQVLRLAIKHRAGANISIDMAPVFATLDPEDPIAVADASETLFDALAAGSRNAEHASAIRRAADRLYAVRLRESAIRDRIGELRSVWIATSQGRESTVREAIWAYHRRRLRRVPALVRAVNASAALVSPR